MGERQTETTRRVYKYRVYPSKRQVALLEEQLSFCCDLYNAVLRLRRDAWRDCAIKLTHVEVSKQLTELVRDCPELIPEGMSRSMLQKTIERNNRAFQAFFRRVNDGRKPGYPRFRSRRRYDTLTSQHGRSYGVELLDTRDERARGRGTRTRYLYWRGVGALKVRFHRLLPADGRITEAQVRRQADGWHICLCIEMPRTAPLPPTGRRIGVDLGITNFVAISDGAQDEVSPGPRARRNGQRRIARLQREVSRKGDKQSNRRRAAVRRLAKARLREARIRRDHHHKLAHRLVREADVIYLEDLSVKKLADSYLAKDVRDQGWSQFRAILTDKAADAGRSLVLVDPRGTSQECSDCGAIVKKRLNQRVHACPCGLSLDRDVNAARVILRRGERRRAEVVDLGPKASAAEGRETGRPLSATHELVSDRWPTCSKLSV